MRRPAAPLARLRQGGAGGRRVGLPLRAAPERRRASLATTTRQYCWRPLQLCASTQRSYGLAPCLGAAAAKHTGLQACRWRTALLEAAGRRLEAERRMLKAPAAPPEEGAAGEAPRRSPQSQRGREAGLPGRPAEVPSQQLGVGGDGARNARSDSRAGKRFGTSSSCCAATPPVRRDASHPLSACVLLLSLSTEARIAEACEM